MGKCDNDAMHHSLSAISTANQFTEMNRGTFENNTICKRNPNKCVNLAVVEAAASNAADVGVNEVTACRCRSGVVLLSTTTSVDEGFYCFDHNTVS